MDEIHFAPPKKPWDDDSSANTNKHWFQPWFQSGAKWISSICSRGGQTFLGGSRLLLGPRFRVPWSRVSSENRGAVFGLGSLFWSQAQEKRSNIGVPWGVSCLEKTQKGVFFVISLQNHKTGGSNSKTDLHDRGIPRCQNWSATVRPTRLNNSPELNAHLKVRQVA